MLGEPRNPGPGLTWLPEGPESGFLTGTGAEREFARFPHRLRRSFPELGGREVRKCIEVRSSCRPS